MSILQYASGLLLPCPVLRISISLCGTMIERVRVQLQLKGPFALGDGVDSRGSLWPSLRMHTLRCPWTRVSPLFLKRCRFREPGGSIRSHISDALAVFEFASCCQDVQSSGRLVSVLRRSLLPCFSALPLQGQCWRLCPISPPSKESK